VSLDLSTLSDGELVTLSLAGRDAPFAEIVRRHRTALFRIARAYSGDADEALDVMQETFVAAHAALRRYDPARPLRAWLMVIALNKSRDWGRKRVVRRFLSFAGPPDAAARMVDEQPGAETALAARQELTRVARAIAELPARMQEVLILRTIEGLSQTETADMLAISGKAVETRLHRARARLTETLDSDQPGLGAPS